MENILYIIFVVLGIGCMFVDFVVLHNDDHIGEYSESDSTKIAQKRFRDSIKPVIMFVSIALGYGVLVYTTLGHQAGLEFFTGYIIELSLSVDNLFIFIMIFSYFKIPSHLQYRVLFWGIVGAVIMRILMIYLGLWLIEKLDFIFYIFGIIIIYAAYKILKNDHDTQVDNTIINFIKRYVPVTKELHGQSFFVRKNGVLYATPMFITLLVVEKTDLIFALDSIPAILAITQNPLIVVTSNIFAILGLRSMYFVLRGLLDKLRYIHVGLSIILMFIGSKMLLHGTFKVPTEFSLLFVASVLSISVFASLYYGNKKDPSDEIKKAD